MPLLYAHISIAGGLGRALDQGRETGCAAIQIFAKSRNQRQGWELSLAEIKAFQKARQSTGIHPVAAHDSYLIHLTSADQELARKFRLALLDPPPGPNRQGKRSGAVKSEAFATVNQGIGHIMIVFDLECAAGHVFEGWFNDSGAFEDQKTKGLVSCPYCESTDIRRILSPVVMKKSSHALPAETEARQIDYRRLAREVVDYINNHFEDVGPRFYQEALKMHYNVMEKKNIRGSATAEEEKLLQNEGIEFFKIPFLKTDNEKKN